MVVPCFPPAAAVFPLAVAGRDETLGFVGTILILPLASREEQPISAG